jgi:hypothetical protein
MLHADGNITSKTYWTVMCCDVIWKYLKGVTVKKFKEGRFARNMAEP